MPNYTGLKLYLYFRVDQDVHQAAAQDCPSNAWHPALDMEPSPADHVNL